MQVRVSSWQKPVSVAPVLVHLVTLNLLVVEALPEGPRALPEGGQLLLLLRDHVLQLLGVG